MMCNSDWKGIALELAAAAAVGAALAITECVVKKGLTVRLTPAVHGAKRSKPKLLRKRVHEARSHSS